MSSNIFAVSPSNFSSLRHPTLIETSARCDRRGSALPFWTCDPCHRFQRWTSRIWAICPENNWVILTIPGDTRLSYSSPMPRSRKPFSKQRELTSVRLPLILSQTSQAQLGAVCRTMIIARSWRRFASMKQCAAGRSR
jgi:hypothetical protein